MGTDTELCGRLRRREAAAFDEVYAQYSPRIWRFLLRLAGRRELAEDLFQDTWLSVARHAGDVAEDTELLPWLFTIARNRHRSHRRWAVFDWTRLALLAGEPAEHAPAPDRTAEARAEAAAVTRVFERLSAAHREVLLLGVVEGLEAPQIAEVLGIKADAVRQRLSRARAELAGRLEKEDALGREIKGGETP